jgi:hypothetical protein
MGSSSWPRRLPAWEQRRVADFQRALIVQGDRTDRPLVIGLSSQKQGSAVALPFPLTLHRLAGRQLKPGVSEISLEDSRKQLPRYHDIAIAVLRLIERPRMPTV